MRKYIWLLGMFLSAMACKKQEQKITYKLTDEQLMHLAYDVQFSDVAIAGLPKAKQDSLKTMFWSKLTTIYGLSEEEMKAEIKKMESDPEKMKKVFDEIKALSDTIR